MVTSDGVVQAGAVPPKCLKDLADAAGVPRTELALCIVLC